MEILETTYRDLLYNIFNFSYWKPHIGIYYTTFSISPHYVIYQHFGDLLKVLDRALSNYFVELLDCWKFNAFIYQHFGDLLKVLDGVLSNYFVGLLDCWKFNAFIYQHFQQISKMLIYKSIKFPTI